MIELRTHVRTIAMLALLASAGAGHLHAQRIGGRTLGDPGRDPLPRAADSAQAGAPAFVAMGDQDARPAPRYTFVVTPSVTRTDGALRYGAQFRVVRDGKIPLAAALTEQLIHTEADDRISNRIQGDVALDVVPEGSVGGFPVYLGLFGTLRHTQRSGTDAELSTEADVTVLGKGVPSVALKAIGYYGFAWPSEGDFDSGLTLGTGAILALTRAVTLDTEYDFDSEFNGEDSWSARLILRIPARRVQPALIVGGGKHGVVQVALRVAR